MSDYERMFALSDIEISRSGDGRQVVAYAAVFNDPQEIHDKHGDYIETIDRSAFDTAIARGIGRVNCHYHHGMTLHGTPSDLGTVPIGRPLEIRADGKGLLTTTQFNRSALADAVLESIKNGDITGYSFRGAIVRSSPEGRVTRNRDGSLRTVTRHEMGLTEYGPTPSPAYAGAGVVAVRYTRGISDARAHALTGAQRGAAIRRHRQELLRSDWEDVRRKARAMGILTSRPARGGRR